MKAPIRLIVAIFAISLVTYRRWLPVEWPFVEWTMYSKKADRPNNLRYRRFVLHHRDGSSTVTDLSRPLSFLGKAYRVDALLRRDLGGFLVAYRRLVQAHGISYEIREWTLDDNVHATGTTYRVVEVPSREKLAAAGNNLLVNGSFDEWDASGTPRGWKARQRTSMGIGIDARDDKSLIVDSKKVTQTVDAQAGTFKLEAWVRSEGDPVSLELAGTRSEECPRDGEWHRLSVTHKLDAPGQLKVILYARGAFDDVVLSP